MKKEKDKTDYGMSVRIRGVILDKVRAAAEKNDRTIKGQIEKSIKDGLRNAK